jgi:formylglycine-generating enzyme required for sulfatase activity
LERALRWERVQVPSAAWAVRYGSAEEFEVAMEFLRASERAWSEERRLQEAQEAEKRASEQKEAASKLRRRAIAAASAAVAALILFVVSILISILMWKRAESARAVANDLRLSILEKATKEQPWQNSLGMKFVPVAGTQVLFSVWDTRVQDFEMFVKSTGYDATEGMYSIGKYGWYPHGATWKEPGFSQGPTHPVVGISWNNAEEFCKWLTKRERSAGDLPQDREYRLPTDEEWSAAVGLKNEIGNTPEDKDSKIQLYPWDIPQKRDKSWPPPAGAGNYAGEEAKIGDWPSEWPIIEGYNDGYPRTSPVGSFQANFGGLYDMGGNVWQWCEDWFNAEKNQYRVLRGASWLNRYPGSLLASSRRNLTPVDRYDNVGFRCVVAVEPSP